MTLEIVKNRLDKLISEKTPKVLILTGDWGSGKTYQWKQALERATKNEIRPRYAYVSLFGLTSLAEVRKRITEEVISAVKLPGSSTVGEELAGKDTIRLKPMQILKILPMIPYLSKFDSLAQELSFSTVRNSVICIDDLERAPSSLRIADVLGLASFLKEERNCRVLLISNQQRLGNETKDEFRTYFEKVVDESVDFAPTPEEACYVALGSQQTESSKILTVRLLRLGVSNIRVISRLGVLAQELATLVEGCHPEVLTHVVNTLTFFGIAHFIPRKTFPTPEYLLEYGRTDWKKFFNQEKKEEEKTGQEKLESTWDQLITTYGYKRPTQLEKEIYAGITSGFFRDNEIRRLSKDLSQQIDEGDCKNAFDNAIFRFWWGVSDSQVALQQLLVKTKDALELINASEFYPVYQILLELEGENAATELLNKFIAANHNRRKALIPKALFGSNYNKIFADKLHAAAERLNEPFDLSATLDALDVNNRWEYKEITKIANADFDTIVPLLTDPTDDELFARRLTTLLKFGEHGKTPEEKKVCEKTIDWLKKMTRTDPICALRMRRFIPEGDVPKSPSSQANH